MDPTVTIPTPLPRRILVLDDEDLLSWCIDFELRQLGYEVHLAHDLKSGREALSLHAPNLIICDQVFPDGLSLAMLSKWYENHERIATILITAYTPPSAQEMSDACVHCCLSKPFNLSMLMGIIDDYFSGAASTNLALINQNHVFSEGI